MQPVDHLQMRVEIDALKRRHPRLKNFDPADRAIIATLPRRFLAQFPGGADAADEDQTGIAGLGHVDGHLALAQLLLSDHRFNPTKCSGPSPPLTTARDRLRRTWRSRPRFAGALPNSRFSGATHETSRRSGPGRGSA